MKLFRFNLTNDFQLNEISRTNFYEKESNSSIVLIKGENYDFIYNMHFVNGDINVVMPIDYVEGYFTCKIPNNILSNKGTARMQFRGFDGDVVIESNIIEFDIEEFLNASGEPTPEEISIIEKLQIEVKTISDDLNAKANKTTVDALSDKVDTKADIDDVNALGARVDTLDSETLDIYSKLELKADAISVYDKDTIDAQLNAKANKSDVYTKTDANNKFANKIDTTNALNNKLDKTTIATTTVAGLIKTGTKYGTYVNPYDGILTALVMAGESGYNSLLDNAFISKGTLNAVLARLPQTSGMQFYKVTYEGGNIEHEGIALTYNQLVSKYNDPNYFLYAEAYGLTFIPSFPPIVGDEVLAFINTCIYGGAVTVSRIIINSDNEVKYSDEVLAKQSDVTRLNSSVVSLAERVENVVDEYIIITNEVTEIKADLSQLDTEIQNHETRIVALEQGGGSEVSKEYVDHKAVSEADRARSEAYNGYTTENNVVKNVRINNLTGLEESSTTMWSSTFIEVEPNTAYTFDGIVGRSTEYRYVEYDDSKAYVTGSVGSSTRTSYNFTTNARTKYVRLSFKSTDLTANLHSGSVSVYTVNEGTVYTGINDLIYKTGDTVTFPATTLSNFSGFVNATKKSIIFNVPLSKPIRANGVTLSGSFMIRGVSGPVHASTVFPFSAATATIVDNGLMLRVDFGSELSNVVANSLINVMVIQDDFVITFT